MRWWGRHRRRRPRQFPSPSPPRRPPPPPSRPAQGQAQTQGQAQAQGHEHVSGLHPDHLCRPGQELRQRGGRLWPDVGLRAVHHGSGLRRRRLRLYQGQLSDWLLCRNGEQRRRDSRESALSVSLAPDLQASTKLRRAAGHMPEARRARARWGVAVDGVELIRAAAAACLKPRSGSNDLDGFAGNGDRARPKAGNRQGAPSA